MAGIAMQESTCNPSASDPQGGSYGLMQITPDKCGGAPNGNCEDPVRASSIHAQRPGLTAAEQQFNINAGANYIGEMLSMAQGNILLALGAYNGWSPGLTPVRSTSDLCIIRLTAASFS